MMRCLVKPLGIMAIAALVAACSQPPLPSRADRLSSLRNMGLIVRDEDVIEQDKELHFPQGECGAVFRYFDGRPQLDVFKGEGVPLEVLYGDNIKNVGKTGATRVCNLDKGLTSPSETSSTKVDAGESK